MEYTIEWTRRADRSLGRVPRNIRRDVIAAVDALASDPRPRGTRKLEGKLKGLYRIRVGMHYRLTYTVDDVAHLIVVENVGSREGSY